MFLPLNTPVCCASLSLSHRLGLVYRSSLLLGHLPGSEMPVELREVVEVCSVSVMRSLPMSCSVAHVRVSFVVMS